MKTFHRLVVNTLIASVTNNFLWFALTFWVYLETRSVVASSVIGGSYMLLLSVSALFFGTYVDHHRRKTSMLASSVGLVGRLPPRRGAVPRRTGGVAAGLRPPGLLGARRPRARRCHRREPALGGVVDDGHAARPRGRPRQGQRARRHGQRRRVRPHVGLQWAGDRLPRHGLVTRHRRGADDAGRRAPVGHPDRGGQGPASAR